MSLLLLSDHFPDETVNATAEEEMPVSSEELQVTMDSGVTALHVAAKFGCSAVARLLLESERFKVMNDATAELCHNALHITARYGHGSVAAMLLQIERFNAVNDLDFWGHSALHIAARFGNLDVAKLLLESPKFSRASHQNASGQAMGRSIELKMIDYRPNWSLGTKDVPNATSSPEMSQHETIIFARWTCLTTVCTNGKISASSKPARLCTSRCE